MNSESTFAIESRIQLFSALAEASEIEHNLMCLYLFSMFSLKRSQDEGVSEEELQAIKRWKKVLLSVALEEMTHLALVSNLLSAMGCGPNFMRPNFPSSPGFYPADIVIELTPFDMSTIEHFIYLERPRTEELADGASFDHSRRYTRVSEKGRLMPSSGDYGTVGSLYVMIREAIEKLSAQLGEKNLFCGSKDQQIGPLDAPLPGLVLITNTEQALQAIDTIIAQGEGATTIKDSHFQRFCGVRDEYQILLNKNPDFVPARPVARNPVMRKPLDPENRVWVTEKISAQFMDLANALYSMMLRALVQVYSIENRPKESKAIMVQTSLTLMHAMASVAETLTFLPANPQNPGVLSGMSFAMVRFLAPLKANAERTIIVERCAEVIAALTGLRQNLEVKQGLSLQIAPCIDQLRATEEAIKQVQEQISRIPNSPVKVEEVQATGNQKAVAASPVETSLSVDVAESDAILVTFDGGKCIHSRHCVTELPFVFKANTPGKWIFAENAHPEVLAAVARECPSGAIQYTRKDGGPNELLPDVNLVRLRENGPYAFVGELTVDGKKVGTRATLCRCGQSKKKPYCDNSHTLSQFLATGSPPTLDDAALKIRNGPLEINRTVNGPLFVQGNMEVCAGTGRVVLRTVSARFCRCGHSKNKPLCDNSHVEAGFKDELT